MSLQRFTIIQTSNFNGLNRFRSEGAAAITPMFQQRQDVGFNALRDWTVFDIPMIGRSAPTADLYAAIPDYLGLCADHGHYVELTAFTGPYPFFPNQATMIAHWEAIDRKLDEAIAAGCTNILDIEAINEGENAPNLGVPLNLLRRPTGKIASHGSNIQDAPPMQPVWDVAQHRPGASEEWRKVGHNPMWDVADVYHIPSWCNETARRPDNDPDPQHAYDAAASAALLCAGSCFHSPGGKNATLFTGLELQLAQAWCDGARSVPLEFQAGAYSRPPNPDASIIRVYRRTLPDGRFKEVPIHA